MNKYIETKTISNIKKIPQSLSPNLSNSNEENSLNDYIIGETLGKGTFGKVKLATHKLTKEKVAIKFIDKSKIIDSIDKQRINREIKILKNTFHCNIIKIYQVIEIENFICIIIEYAGGGELFKYILEKKHLTENESRKIFQQIIDAINYIHQIGICHRDLKPENILFTNKNKNKIKIIDFGLSNLYLTGVTSENPALSFGADFLETPCGSPGYAPPEMILGCKYDGLLTDIWSSGIILYAMLFGCLPFDDICEDKLYSKIIKGDFYFPENINVSDDVKKLLKKILVVNPRLRSTIKDIRSDNWFLKDYKPAKGLFISIREIPVCDEIIDDMKKFGFKKNEIIENVKNNRHNKVTTFYYLLVQKYANKGIETKSDMFSNKFKEYLDEQNLKSKLLKKNEKPISLKIMKYNSKPLFNLDEKIQQDNSKNEHEIVDLNYLKLLADKCLSSDSNETNINTSLNNNMNYVDNKTENKKTTKNKIKKITNRVIMRPDNKKQEKNSKSKPHSKKHYNKINNNIQNHLFYKEIIGCTTSRNKKTKSNCDEEKYKKKELTKLLHFDIEKFKKLIKDIKNKRLNTKVKKQNNYRSNSSKPKNKSTSTNNTQKRKLTSSRIDKYNKKNHSYNDPKITKLSLYPKNILSCNYISRYKTKLINGQQNKNTINKTYETSSRIANLFKNSRCFWNHNKYYFKAPKLYINEIQTTRNLKNRFAISNSKSNSKSKSNPKSSSSNSRKKNQENKIKKIGINLHKKNLGIISKNYFNINNNTIFQNNKIYSSRSRNQNNSKYSYIQITKPNSKTKSNVRILNNNNEKRIFVTSIEMNKHRKLIKTKRKIDNLNNNLINPLNKKTNPTNYSNDIVNTKKNIKSKSKTMKKLENKIVDQTHRYNPKIITNNIYENTNFQTIQNNEDNIKYKHVIKNSEPPHQINVNNTSNNISKIIPNLKGISIFEQKTFKKNLLIDLPYEMKQKNDYKKLIHFKTKNNNYEIYNTFNTNINITNISDAPKNKKITPIKKKDKSKTNLCSINSTKFYKINNTLNNNKINEINNIETKPKTSRKTNIININNNMVSNQNTNFLLDSNQFFFINPKVLYGIISTILPKNKIIVIKQSNSSSEFICKKGNSKIFLELCKINEIDDGVYINMKKAGGSLKDYNEFKKVIINIIKGYLCD